MDNQLEAPIAATPVSDDLIELAYMFAISKTPGPKEMCNLCQKMHPTGECWAKLTCAVCGINGHPSDRCFKRCENPKCVKDALHLKDRCPYPRLSPMDTLREQLRASEAQVKRMEDLCKAKGITDAHLKA